MRISKDRIPDEVLKKIFPQKLMRCRASEWVYAGLKQWILSGRIRKGQRLLREEIVQHFNVSETAVTEAFSQLKKDGLVITKGGGGSLVA